MIRSCRLFAVTLLPLCLTACDQIANFETEAHFEKRAGDAFYCYATAESLSLNVDAKYDDDVDPLAKNALDIMAGRFCKPEEVEHFVCVTLGFFKDQSQTQTLGRACEEPRGLDQDSFAACAERVNTFHKEKMLTLLEARNRALLVQYKLTDMDEPDYLEQYYRESCGDLLAELSINRPGAL